MVEQFKNKGVNIKQAGESVFRRLFSQTDFSIVNFSPEIRYGSLLATMDDMGLISGAFDLATTRIRQETGFFADSDSIEAMARRGRRLNMSNQLVGDSFMDQLEVRWEERGDGRRLGSYSDRRITMYVGMPSLREMLFSLATQGEKPEGAQTWDHELAHAVQDMGVKKPDHEFMEVQAYRIGGGKVTDTSSDKLFNHITKSSVYAHLEPAKVRAAIWVVDSLMATEANQQQIIEVFKHPGSWNPSKNIWSEIPGYFEDTNRDLGIDLEELRRRRALYVFSKQEELGRVRGITRDVLDGIGKEILTLANVGRAFMEQIRMLRGETSA